MFLYGLTLPEKKQSDR